jgi:GntR family transcriptional regulator/MocR family aminotransferase
MELLIPIDAGSKKPLYEQIYTYIRDEIRKGNLAAGERLPSTRNLAQHLQCSRSTTQLAYEQLLAEGYIEARPYKGNFVCGYGELVDAGPQTPDRMEMQNVELSAVHTGDNWIDFSPRGIDLGSFPYNIWRKLSRNTLVDDKKEFFQAGNHQGEPGLRMAVRGYLHSARGVECDADQIIIGAGSEYLLMLLSQLLGPDCRIAMENPTYKQAYRVFDSLGYDVVPVDMDGFGIIPELLEQSGADVAYIMPAHQHPTGIVMPVGRRRELLRWAQQSQERYIIEDDYDSEFRYRGKPIPAMQGMDRQGKVIYMGTFSKSIAPAIRVSYMVLPERLLKLYREKAGFYASTVSRIDQNIIYQFMAQGHFERHLNRMRGIYKSKHDALMTALRPLEQDFAVQGENAGLHILLTDRHGRTEEELIALADQAHVRVYGISGYYIHPEHIRMSGTVVIGFANLSEEEMRDGAGRLVQCWRVS